LAAVIECVNVRPRMDSVLTVAPGAEQEKGAVSRLGVYVHVPFCATTCDYCAFYQVRPQGDDLARFLATIEAELALVPRPLKAGTVFWGGGTPGLLPPRELAQLGALVRNALAAEPVEWTVELAPTTVTPERLAVLRAMGVTRVSLGVQSLQPRLLEALGRRHARAQALRAYERVRAAGFASVNLDLIFAIPGQSDDDWRADLREAAALGSEHLSTYCLTFEEDTALYVKLARGRVRLDPEREARFYEIAAEELEAAGWRGYEISNFARPGHECIHNLNTWAMGEWLGFGPAAASQHDGWRYANPADLAAWTAAIAAGRRGGSERVQLTPELLAADCLIFGLRCHRGVDEGALRARFAGVDWTPWNRLADRLAGEGLLERSEGRVWLTARGRLLADAVGAAVLDIWPARSAAEGLRLSP
jgi:oxygen-independent coproporphyrinogen-3 oxidase